MIVLLRTSYNTPTGQVYRRPRVWRAGIMLAGAVLSFAVALPLLLAAVRPPQPAFYLVVGVFSNLLRWGWIAVICLVIAELCGSLKLAPEGITLQFLGWSVTTPWSNVRRIDHGDTLLGKGLRLRLIRPVTARPRRFIRNARPPVVNAIPLHIFTRNWAQSQLRIDLQHHAPHLVTPTEE